MDFEKAKQLLPGYNNVKRKAAMEQRTKSAIAQLAEYGQDWENAESRLRDLLTLVPDDAIGNERLARSLFWQGKARDAYETLKKATKLDRENSKNNKTSEVFPAPEAIMAQYYEEFEGLQSENPEVWFRYALKTAPNDVRTRQAVAAWALRKGKPAVAKEQAAAAAHLNKDTISDLLFGLVAMSEKNWLEAEKRFERVLTRDPSNLAVKCNLARALVEQKDATKTQRAVEYAEALWRDAPSDPDVLSTLACIYFRRGQFDRAGLALDHVLKAAAGNLNPDMATYLAHVLCRQEKWREAQEILDGILANQREFSMRSEAETLYEKVSRAVRPQTSPCLTPP